MRQAMILAAGLGTRLKPLTDTMPKALVPVGGQPLLWHVLMRLKEAGFERVVVNVHHHANLIRNYLCDNYNFGWGRELCISDESDQLLDTGGALKRAAWYFDSDSPILVHNVDILSNADLNMLYEAGCRDNESAPYLGQNSVLLVSERPTNRHLYFADDMRLMGWRNETTGDEKHVFPEMGLRGSRPLAFGGIHVIAPSLLKRMSGRLLSCSWPDRFSIIDFYLAMAAEWSVVGQVQPDLRLLDVGKLDSLHEAEAFLRTM